MLTEASIQAAAPRDRAYKLYDYDGMFLLVTPRGTRLWRLKYRIGGREKTLSLGMYPEVSLLEARRLRDALRAKVRSGLDPALERHALRGAARAERRVTVAARRMQRFHVELTQEGELTLYGPHHALRLSAQSTEALRAFFIAEFATIRSSHGTD
jgi:hypothetical protein